MSYSAHDIYGYMTVWSVKFRGRCTLLHENSSSFYSLLNKANITDTEAPFLDLHLSVANGFVSSKIYDKRDDFDFDIVNFPFFGW